MTDRRRVVTAVNMRREPERVHQIAHSLVFLIGGQIDAKYATAQRRQFAEQPGIQSRILGKPIRSMRAVAGHQ